LGNVEIAISAVSAGELLHGCRRADTPARRARREEFVEAMLSALPVVDITLPVMRVFAEIDARLRAKGATLPTSDLLIASTALSRADEVVTGNVRHFRSVPGLTVHEWP
jgi:predicted nucleic acid-binding protein